MISASSQAVRRARASDASAIAVVLREAFAEYKPLYTADGYVATTPGPEEVRHRMTEGPLWVALRDGKIVGTVSAVAESTGVYVRGMAVIPAAAGVGIGRALLGEVERFAFSHGVKRLFLCTTPFLDRAIRLYESSGFVRTSDGPHDLFGTPLITMEKITQPRSGAEMAGVVHTCVFAARQNGGNPCPVVLSADCLSESEMRSIARTFGLDTVFILNPQSDGADIRLRFFVPDHEMGISGHATIAAITVALANGMLRSHHVKVETSSGRFDASWAWKNGSYLVTLEQNPPLFGVEASADRVASALSISADCLASNESPIQAVSVSRPKLLVPLTDARTLSRLVPDFEALWNLCDDLVVSGVYAFTRQTNKPHADAEARQFPLRAGFREDAATGVAAAALGAYLATYDLKCQSGQHEFRIAQGYAMRAPSLIEAIAECRGGAVRRTAIRGTAQIVRYECLRVSA